MSVTPIRPPATETAAEPPVLPLLPRDAATVAAGTPVAALTLDGERFLVVPSGAVVEDDAQAVALPLPCADALRVAAGYSTLARTRHGQDLVVRPPTIDELATVYNQTAAGIEHREGAAVPTLGREGAEQLLRPLDLAELAATLIDGGAHGSTYRDRTALVLRSAGHETTPPIGNPDETALMAALAPLELYAGNAVEAMARLLAGDAPGPGYQDVGHLMLADLQQIQRLLRHVRMDLDNIARFRAPRP